MKLRKLPIRPIFTPRRTLKHMICRSRLFDQRGCLFGNPANCQVCPVISGSGCAIKYAVLWVTCRLFFIKSYDKAMDRPSALSPSLSVHKKSACNNLQTTPRQHNNVRLKISEAVKINKDTFVHKSIKWDYTSENLCIMIVCTSTKEVVFTECENIFILSGNCTLTSTTFNLSVCVELYQARVVYFIFQCSVSTIYCFVLLS